MLCPVALLALLGLAAATPPDAGVQPDPTSDILVDSGPRPIEPREHNDADGANGASDGQALDAGTLADAGAASIPDVIMTARVEPDPVTFGEPFALVVTLVRERGVRVDLPGTIPDVEGAPRTGDATRSVVDDDGAPGPDGGTRPRVKETIRIPFLALDTQDLKTPALVLAGKDGSSLDVPALNVRVVVPPDAPPPDGGPAPQPGQVMLEAAAPVIAYAVPDDRPWIVAGSLAGLAAVALLARWVLRRRRARQPIAPAVPPPPPRPAHEVALERLDALLASGLLQRGETATFVERLMDEVLRDYLSARFALPAGTRTTRELVKDLLGIAVTGLDVALVESLLADADLVKFARASIASEQAHGMATRVRALVEQTKLAPTEGP